ncbi:MAG: DUF4932 domain-containing protein [bacterium]|nr:DUF4932 domain-containing protein [bacterium]
MSDRLDMRWPLALLCLTLYPLVDAHWAALEPSAQRIFAHCKGAMGLQAYGSARIMTYESFVRAAVRRYHLAGDDSAAAPAHNAQQRKLGFVWVEGLAGVLARYEQGREDYARLDSFMPETIEFLEEFAREYDRKMQLAPHIVSVVPDPTQLVDPAVDELVITFDRPMQRSYSITRRGRSPEFGKPAYDEGGRVLRVPMQLQPGVRYAVSLNSLQRTGFKSRKGLALDPYGLTFRTRGR